MWAYEQIFVIASLVGLGLPVALAGYAKARWPEALGGTIGYGDRPAHVRRLQVPLAGIVAAGCVLLGLAKVYWALGGPIGIDPARPEARDLWWHLLTLSTGLRSLTGAWGALVLASRRRFGRFLPPMMAGWVSSGILFSYNPVFGMRADSQASPEYPLARVLSTEAGIVLGPSMAPPILLSRATLGSALLSKCSPPSAGEGTKCVGQPKASASEGTEAQRPVPPATLPIT